MDLAISRLLKLLNQTSGLSCKSALVVLSRILLNHEKCDNPAMLFDFLFLLDPSLGSFNGGGGPILVGGKLGNYSDNDRRANGK